MKRRLRSGFTLVELLVVITIIAVLMGLLLPAVNAARENARRTECLNNLKQLSIAAQSYDSRNRALPGYVNEIAKTSGVGTGRMATWLVTLLPDMDRNDLWSRWNDPTINPANLAPLVSNYMQLLICASDPPDTQEDSWLAYVANCGLPDCVATGGRRRENNLANGVFFDHFSLEVPNTPSRPEKRISMSLDSIADGASNTLMFSENIQADRYAKQVWLNVAPQQYPMAQVFDVERSTGFIWYPSLDSPAMRINGDKKYGPVGPSDPISLNNVPQYYYSRPSSSHSGGVNVAMCGGETLFLREDIDYKVYQQLMTPNGKFSEMMGNHNDPSTPKGYLLNDSDWR